MKIDVVERIKMKAMTELVNAESYSRAKKKKKTDRIYVWYKRYLLGLVLCLKRALNGNIG